TDPYAPVPYGLMSRVQHLADFMDALCLDKVSVIGNSQGAWTGAQYAILHPDRVEKMVLISSLTIANSLNIPQRPTEALKALNDYDGTREGMRRILQALIIDPKRITDKLIDDRQAAATRPGALDAFKAFGRGTAALRQNPLFALQNDMTRSLPVMVKTIPTIFIWGDSDTFALPETGKKIGEFVPEATFHWVPGAGHQEQNERLTQVGPGTPGGELLRRYWQVLCPAGEITEARPKKRVRLLGEDLLVYRGADGAVYCIEEHCLHRRASLFYGFIEPGGIRCCYHGWKFDCAGKCTERPFEKQTPD